MPRLLRLFWPVSRQGRALTGVYGELVPLGLDTLRQRGVPSCWHRLARANCVRLLQTPPSETQDVGLETAMVAVLNTVETGRCYHFNFCRTRLSLKP